MWFTSLIRSVNRGRGRHRRSARNAPRNRSFVPRLEALDDRTLPSTLTVLNNFDDGAGSLRDALALADHGDTIVFDGGLAGQTITLTSDQLTITRSLTIEGPGPDLLSVSGNDRHRVFAIEEGLSVTISGLTITHGRTTGGAWGAGILNAGSALTLDDDVLSFNQNFGSRGSFASGGAVALYNDASLTVIASTFRGNSAIGNSEGGVAFGGALQIRDSRSTARIVDSTFIGNQVIAGDGGVLHGSIIGSSWGGAINNQGTLIVETSTFTDNRAIGGTGGSGGNGSGGPTNVGAANAGAIFSNGMMVVTACLFEHNQTIGGSNNTAAATGSSKVGSAESGAVENYVGAVATITNSTFVYNQALGGSDNTGGSNAVRVGAAIGGAMRNNGTLTLTNCTLTDNRAIGGASNTGGAFVGAGLGGGLANIRAVLRGGSGPSATISGSLFSENRAVGGGGAVGSNGGDSLGGGIYNGDGMTLDVRQSTITHNRATGGAAGAGGSAGAGVGGGLYLAPGGIVCLDAVTVAHLVGNDASTSDDDVFGDFTVCE